MCFRDLLTFKNKSNIKVNLPHRISAYMLTNLRKSHLFIILWKHLTDYFWETHSMPYRNPFECLLCWKMFFSKERSNLKVNFSWVYHQYVQINLVLNGQPIRKQDYEGWIDFYAFKHWNKLILKFGKLFFTLYLGC